MQTLGHPSSRNRSLLPGLALLSCLSWVPAIAEVPNGAVKGVQPLATEPASTGPHAKPPTVAAVPIAKPTDGGTPDSLLLNAADTILVKVLGYPSISGEYRISADDSISVPMIGRVSVANLSTRNLESDLAARVLKQTGKEAYATVEVVKYKPIFVSGQVTNAGSYAWSPGMTVLHAETLSGGIYRPLRQAASSGMAASQTLRERATTDLKASLANQARLTAESSGAEVVEVPERLEWLVGRAEAKQIIDQQQRLLESRNAARKAQLATLRQTLSVAEAELKGLQQQSYQINSQFDIRQGFHEKLMRLKNAGLIPEERALEQQAKLSELEERKTNLAVALSRTQGTILNIKQEIIKLEEVRKAEMETELLNLQRDIQKSAIDLETARNAERLLARETHDLESAADVDKRKSYTIMRRVDGATKQIEATKFTLVQPGDIVVVSLN